MHSLIHLSLSQLIKVVLPFYCCICEEKSTLNLDLCTDCKFLLLNHDPACFCCGNSLATSAGNKLCGACLKKPPYFDRLIFLGQYHLHLQKMIIEFKFHQKLYLARIFGLLLVEKLKSCADALPECIIPVPLHSKRLRQRGFNQALEISKIVSKQLGIPIDYQLCQRIRHTQPQSSIPAKSRQNNVASAFKLTRQPSYKHIAIIDDVITTGLTLNEISKTLKLAGVKYIQVWCIAKTI